jgi:hypothetical protein
MKRIILAIGILSLISNISFAVDQKLDQKQIYELRKECGKSAAEFAQRLKLCDGQGGYTNHYNMKLNVCFIYMTASCNSDKGKDDKFWAESLIDVNENKDYANYIGPGQILFDDKPAMCFVGAKHCKSLLEFQELIKPYMNE